MCRVHPCVFISPHHLALCSIWLDHRTMKFSLYLPRISCGPICVFFIYWTPLGRSTCLVLQPPAIPVASHGLILVCPCPSGEPKAGPSTPDVPPVLSRGEGSPPSAALFYKVLDVFKYCGDKGYVSTLMEWKLQEYSYITSIIHMCLC